MAHDSTRRVASGSVDAISIEVREGVAAIALDDGKANALSPRLIQGLHEALDGAEKDAKAVAITGRPGRFCGGFDLSVLRDGGPEAGAALVIAGAELYLRFLEYPLPIVVGCTGHALAAGAIALMTADYRVGARGDFRIGMNETAIGMTLPRFALEFARARISRRHFERALVQADLYGPESAVDAGYLDRVVDPEEVPSAAFAEATRLAALPQPAFRNSKRRAHEDLVARVRRDLEADVRGMMPRSAG